MKWQEGMIRTALMAGMLVSPAIARAQLPDSANTPADVLAPEPPVYRVDLSGPRLGFTFLPDGSPRSQFGWHAEHQAVSLAGGPQFLVETVVLVGGMENRMFIPNGTLVFGVRLNDGFELGVGPSVSLGGSRGLNSALVVAGGRSFRAGGIRVPVNIVLASNRDGQRVSVVTGWAIRDAVTPGK